MAYNYAAAKAAGLTDQEIQQYLASKGQANIAINPTSQETLPKPAGFDWTSLLPVAGAIGGSFIPGLGNIAGGALGAGLGTLLKQGIKGQGDLGEVAKETALGGVGGVLGKGVSAGAKLIGKGVSGAAENLGVRSLRLQPSQFTKFASRHREDVGQFLKTENALGKGVKDIADQHIQPLQNQFNAIAKKSGLTAQPDDFLTNIDEVANELIEAGGSENAALAEKIRQEALYLLEKDLAPAKFDIAKVDSLRRTFAQKVNWNNPEKAVVDYALADALRKTTIDTANKGGMTGLKEIGIRLSKFRDLEKYATAQENLGRGTLPMGITKWLSVLAGGAAGAGGGPAGMAAGIATNAIVNSPKFMQGVTKAGVKAGQSLEGGIPLPAQVTGQGIARIPEVMGGGQAPVIDGQLMDNIGMGEPNISLAANQESGQGTDADMRKLFLAMMLANPKQAATLKTIFDFGFPKSTVSANQEKGYQKIADAESIAKQIEKEFKKVGGSGRITGRVQELGGVLGINPQTTAYNALREASIGPLARAISAEVGVLTDRDIARAEKLLPKITDTSQEAKLKIKLLYEAIAARRENIGNTPKSIETSIPMPANYPGL